MQILGQLENVGQVQIMSAAAVRLFNCRVGPCPAICVSSRSAAAAGVADHEAVNTWQPVQNIRRAAGFANDDSRVRQRPRFHLRCGSARQLALHALHSAGNRSGDMPTYSVVTIKTAYSDEEGIRDHLETDDSNETKWGHGLNTDMRRRLSLTKSAPDEIDASIRAYPCFIRG